MTAPTAAGLLRRAAEGLESGEITFGREFFAVDSGRCRCAAGAVAWAADPADTDGDPVALAERAAHSELRVAVEALADYLVTELDVTERGWEQQHEWQPHGTVWARDAVETVAGWNDDPDTTVADVIAALTATADLLDPETCTRSGCGHHVGQHDALGCHANVALLVGQYAACNCAGSQS